MRLPAADLHEHRVRLSGHSDTHEFLHFNFPALRSVSQPVSRSLTHPVPDVEKTLLISQVKHEQETHGISEESCGETSKPKNSW